MSGLPRTGREVLLAAVVGILLLARYRAFDLGLPAGGAEFLYHRYNNLTPLPFAPMRGFTEDQLARHVGRLFILGPALVLFSIAVAAMRQAGLRAAGIPGGSPSRWPGGDGKPNGASVAAGAEGPFGVPPRAVALAAGGFGVAMAAVLLFDVLRGRALMEDELVYASQARLYGRGLLGDPTPAWTLGGEFFSIRTAVGIVGKYLPGEPLVQVIGAALGHPALVHLPLAALALVAFHRALRGAGESVAGWATALLAISPMFVFTTATGLSHTTSLACVAVAGMGLQLCREGAARRGALLAGTALGFGLMVRMQAVAPFGGVLGLWALATLLRARRWDGAALLIVSGGVWVAAIAGYNHTVSGDAFTLPWYLFEPVEHFGFGPVWDGLPYVHTPGRAVENLLVTAARFNGWWLGWPASLALLGVWAAVGRPRPQMAPWLWAGAGLVAFNFFYYSPGVSDTGPVYYFELLLPACALGGAAIVGAARRWPDVTAAALAVHLLLGTGSFYGEHHARLERLVEAIHAPAERVLAGIEPPALLITAPGTWELKRGWIGGAFPVRTRHPDDPVLIYSQMDDPWCLDLIRSHPDRTCWYLPDDATRAVPCAMKWPELVAGGE